MSKDKVTFKERIVEGIDNFFSRRLMFLWIFLCIVVLVIIGIFIWNEVDKNTKQNSAYLSEQAQEKYSDWRMASDENEKTRIEEELLADLGKIIKEYPDQYATQKALSIRGSLFSEKKEWDKAARDFRDIAKSFPNSFYAPVALFNAAVCYEELKDFDAAIKALTELVSLYEDSYDVAYALYSIGRISEQQGKFSEAEQFYTQLKDQYSTSNWSKLAQNRLIYLKIEGI